MVTQGEGIFRDMSMLILEHGYTNGAKQWEHAYTKASKTTVIIILGYADLIIG